MRRFLVYTTASLAVIFLSVFGFLYFKYPPGSWKEILIKKAQDELKVKIDVQKIRYGWDGFLKLEGVHLHIEEKPQKNSPPELVIGEIGVLFYPSSLWQKKLDIHSLSIRDVRLKIVQNKKGKYNWERSALWKKWREAPPKKPKKKKTAKPQGKPKDPLFSLDRAEINQVVLKNIILDLKAPQLVPVRGEYRLDAELNFGGDQLDSEIEINTADQESPGLDARLSVPFHFSHLWRNKEDLSQVAERLKKAETQVALRFKKFSSVYWKRFLPNGKIFQSVHGDVLLLKKKDDHKVQISMNELECRLNKKYKKASLTLNGDSIYHLKKKRISSRLLKIRSGGKNSIHLENLMIGNKKKEIGFKAILDLNLEEINPYLPKTMSIQGHASGEVLYQSRENNPKLDLSLKSVSLTQNKAAVVQASGLDIKLADGEIQIPSTTIRTFGQDFLFSATGMRSAQGKVFLTYAIKGEKLDIDQIFDLPKTQQKKKNKKQEAKQETKKAVSPRANPLKLPIPLSFTGRINFGSISFLKLNLSNFSAKTDFKKNVWKLDELVFRLAKGSFKGKYQLRFKKKKKKLRHDFTFEIQNLKLHKLFDLLKKENKIYASAHGRFSGSMKGRSLADLSQSLDAKLLIQTSEGKMVNTFLQKGILNGPLGSLKSKLSHLEFLGFQSEILNRGGDIYIRSFKLVSSDLTLSVTGKFNRDFFGDAYMRLKFNDDFIENVASPLQMGIRSQYKNNWYDLPFSCVQSNILKKGCWQADWN